MNAEKQVDFALPTSFMVNSKAVLWHAAYSVLCRFLDPLFFAEPIRKAAGMK